MDFEHEGPRWGKQYLDGTVEIAGAPIDWGSMWWNDLGPSPHSRVRHGSTLVLEAVQVAVTHDKLNVLNLLSFEKLVRRLPFMQRSQAERPVADIKSRLYMGGSPDAFGGPKTSGFDKWAAEQEIRWARFRKADLETEAIRKGEAERWERARNEKPGGGKAAGKGRCPMTTTSPLFVSMERAPSPRRSPRAGTPRFRRRRVRRSEGEPLPLCTRGQSKPDTPPPFEKVAEFGHTRSLERYRKRQLIEHRIDEPIACLSEAYLGKASSSRGSDQCCVQSAASPQHSFSLRLIGTHRPGS